jgi:TRAP-type mannitol/chloroaromatic compound transport system permease small subunit
MLVVLIGRVTGTVGTLGAWLLAPLIASMAYEVFARHAFNAPTDWAYELGYMLAGTSYMFGIAYCLRQGGHVRVDFVYGALGPRAQALVDLFGFVVLLLPGLLWITWGLAEYAIDSFESGETSAQSAWNPVIWPFRTAWAIGFAVFSLQVVAEIVKCAHRLRHGDGDRDRAARPA